MVYEREIEEEEVQLVNNGIELEMQEIKRGKVKIKSLTEIKKKYKI